jgi:hypothetical protein
VIAGDEERPGSTDPGTGTADDADGGAIFKFIPDSTYLGNDPITGLDDSPLFSGANYAMQVSCQDDRQQGPSGAPFSRRLYGRYRTDCSYLLPGPAFVRALRNVFFWSILLKNAACGSNETIQASVRNFASSNTEEWKNARSLGRALHIAVQIKS